MDFLYYNVEEQDSDEASMIAAIALAIDSDDLDMLYVYFDAMEHLYAGRDIGVSLPGKMT